MQIGELREGLQSFIGHNARTIRRRKLLGNAFYKNWSLTWPKHRSKSYAKQQKLIFKLLLPRAGPYKKTTTVYFKHQNNRKSNLGQKYQLWLIE